MVEAGLNVLCKMSELESAKELLSNMLDAGFSPSYCTYSWRVDGYCMKDNVDEVVALPEVFLNRGFCLNVSVYRALIRRLCKIERVTFSEKLFNQMQGKGISGDSVIYTSLAYVYWKAGMTRAASNLLEEMGRRRIMIKFKLYKCLSAYDASGNRVSQLFWDHVVDREVKYSRHNE